VGVIIIREWSARAPVRGATPPARPSRRVEDRPQHRVGRGRKVDAVVRDGEIVEYTWRSNRLEYEAERAASGRGRS